MPPTKTNWWTPAPFLRLLPALLSGILLGWHCSFPWVMAGGCALLAVVAYAFLPITLQFRVRSLCGFSILFLLLCLGGWLVQHHDVRRQPGWLAKQYTGAEAVVVTLAEAPVARARTYKAVADVQYLQRAGQGRQVTGRVLLYFRKHEGMAPPPYGTRLLVRGRLQPIRNSGNPGAFDYRRYMLFQGVTHHVFVDSAGYKILRTGLGSATGKWLIRSRQAIVAILRSYISGAREQGLAEALLIGYKDDLDRNLVQAYANTGVVHVIAISGLHLGIIYLLLQLLLRPLRKARLLQFLLVVAGLWVFALLAGAQPSVLRSAVMFSCMALGPLINRRASAFNTLALSAFGLLCYHPFWLWDLGFQLSYAAVAGILIFYEPLYRSVYFSNKVLRWVWQLVALTLTAQVFTLPISLYHFHQFPVLFLLTNLVAVPLSSIILVGELLLCLLWFAEPLAGSLGVLLSALIQLLNSYVLRFEQVSFAVWEGFSISTLQAIFLFVAIGLAGCWVLEKRRKALLWSLAALLLCVLLRTLDLWRAQQQGQLIVYNIARQRAVDIVAGRQVYFLGDAALLADGFARNFHLKPARTLLRARSVTPVRTAMVRAGNKVVVFYTGRLPVAAVCPDILIAGGNSRPPQQWPCAAKPVQVVLDGTVRPYRRQQWRAYCRLLGWPIHDVQEQGAFVVQWHTPTFAAPGR